jgi:hypothetical protein
MNRGAAYLTLSAAIGGCSLGLSDLASFLSDDFGSVTDSVQDLDADDLEDVMSTLMLRFRSYLALREAIPFESLPEERCMSQLKDSGAAFFFVADVNCLFGDTVAPADGFIGVSQRQVASDPVEVFKLELDYREVRVGKLTVHGSEKVTETRGSDGANVHVLALVQDGIAFDYTFRTGLVDGEVPVIDYQIPGPDGDILARITNPTSPGGFVSVFLTGLDGTLQCEVRDALWTPDRPPRGSCDNGLVFGLP